MFPYIPHELKLIQFLLSYRLDWLNPFFIVLHQLDSASFYKFAAIAVFCLISAKLGKRFLLVLAMVIALTHILKNFLQQPRPFILDQSLGLVSFNSAFGLPSGAAMAATAMAVLLSDYFHSRKLNCFLASYVGLVCISRVYLGVHFISDVVVGVCLGYLLAKTLLRCIKSVDQIFKKIPVWVQVPSVLALSALSQYFEISSPYTFSLGLFTGAVFVTQFEQGIFSQKLPMILRSTLFLVAGVITYGIFTLAKKSDYLPLLLATYLSIVSLTLCWRSFVWLSQRGKAAV